MWRKHWTVLSVGLAVLAIVATGCGGSAETGEVPAAGEGHNQTAGQNGPAEAVAEFLEAVRAGDDEKTASMLTKLAREKTAQLNLVVAPPGSDTAQFEVGKVEYRGEDGARVRCSWSDLDENDQRRTDELIWMVRRGPEGWRIAGVAATMVEGQPPRAVNFESPEEMAALQQRSQPQPSQFQRPQSPKEPIRR